MKTSSATVGGVDGRHVGDKHTGGRGPRLGNHVEPRTVPDYGAQGRYISEEGRRYRRAHDDNLRALTFTKQRLWIGADATRRFTRRLQHSFGVGCRRWVEKMKLIVLLLPTGGLLRGCRRPRR